MNLSPSNTPESAWIPGTAGLSLAQLWAMLWARKWIAIIIAAVIAVTTLGVLLAKKKTYESFATVLVDYQSNDPTLFGGFSASLELSYLTTQSQLLNSRRVMSEALQSLGWDADPEALAAFRGIAGGQGSFIDWLASQYLKDTWVSTDPESRLVHVGYANEDPAAAAALVNALIDAYLSSTASIVQGPAGERATRFKAQSEQARSDLEQAQRALNAYQQNEGLVDISERVNAQQDRLVDLTGRLVAAQSARNDVESRLAAVEAMRRRGESIDRQAEVLARGGNTGGEAARLQLQTLLARRAELAESLGPNHPRIVSIASEIAALRQQIRRSVSNAINTLKREAELARQSEAELQARVDAQRAVLLELEQKTGQLDALRQDMDLAQARYNSAVKRYDEAAIATDNGTAGVSVVRRAVPATEATGPSKFVLLIAGCFVGGLIGIAAALLAELLSRRLRVDEDIEREWKIPVLAEIAA